MAKDCKDGKTCALCAGKLGFAEKNYKHILSDGALCQRCHMTILRLLSCRKWWVDDGEYERAVRTKTDYRKAYSMPLGDAQALLALRDSVSGRYLRSVGLESGSVFAVREVFAMPKSPAIFILRAMKLKNKAVLQGFALKGEIRKGDSVTLSVGGAVRAYTALDVVPAGTDPLEKATFFDRLAVNIHRHRLTEGGGGWMIIDAEDCGSIPEGGFAAARK